MQFHPYGMSQNFKQYKSKLIPQKAHCRLFRTHFSWMKNEKSFPASQRKVQILIAWNFFKSNLNQKRQLLTFLTKFLKRNFESLLTKRPEFWIKRRRRSQWGKILSLWETTLKTTQETDIYTNFPWESKSTWSKKCPIMLSQDLILKIRNTSEMYLNSSIKLN